MKSTSYSVHVLLHLCSKCFPHLAELDMSFNLLSGPIPVELSELSKIQELEMHHNELEGPLVSVSQSRSVSPTRGPSATGAEPPLRLLSRERKCSKKLSLVFGQYTV